VTNDALFTISEMNLTINSNSMADVGLY